jgi:hypothetical protein
MHFLLLSFFRGFILYFPLLYMYIFGSRALILIQVLFIAWYTEPKIRVTFSLLPYQQSWSLATILVLHSHLRS